MLEGEEMETWSSGRFKADTHQDRMQIRITLCSLDHLAWVRGIIAEC